MTRWDGDGAAGVSTGWVEALLLFVMVTILGTETALPSG